MYYTRNRQLTRLVAPVSEPVSLNEAKLHLRINDNTDDTLVSDLIVAARMMAEEWLKRSLITQTWKLSYDGAWPGLEPLMWPATPLSSSIALSGTSDWLYNIVRLPMGPVSSITSVVTINRDGSSQTLDSNSYYLNAAQNELVLTSSTYAFRIEITYVAGYGSASAVPRPVKQGLLTHIAMLYDNRGGDADMAMPAQSLGLYMPFREVRL